jgi:hypothetical protein
MKYYLFLLALFSGTVFSESRFVCGDAFRQIAQWRCDDHEWNLDPQSMQYADIVFVKPDYQGRFFAETHPQIPLPYILVTHNGDISSPGEFESYVQDPMILHWYAQQMSIRDRSDRVSPIPVGIANPCWRHGCQEEISAYCRLRGTAFFTTPALSRLFYLNFTIATNPAMRQPCAAYFKEQGFGSMQSRTCQAQYLASLGRSKFTVSPPGNGMDCHRTWEALILGSIPIVQSTTIDRLFQNLPVWIVDRWEEVTPETANAMYAQIQARFDMQRPPREVYADYWTQLIPDKQNQLRQDHAQRGLSP